MNISLLSKHLPDDKHLSEDVFAEIKAMSVNVCFVNTYGDFPQNLLKLCALNCFANGQPVTANSIRFYLENKCEDLEKTFSLSIDALIFLQEMRKCQQDLYDYIRFNFNSLLDEYFPEVPYVSTSTIRPVSFSDIAIQETANIIQRLNHATQKSGN
jgi:hypothetical protein